MEILYDTCECGYELKEDTKLMSVGFDIAPTDNGGFYEQDQFLCPNCDRIICITRILNGDYNGKL